MLPKIRLVVSLGSNPPRRLSVFPPSCLPFRASHLLGAWTAKPQEGAPMAAQPKAPWEFSCDLQVDFESDEKASMVYAALAVDKELQPDKVKRNMSVSDGKLSVRFEAVEARFLRASYSSFVDVLTLATKTIEEFGGGMVL